MLDRHLDRVQAAIDASETLRLPGGDALARILTLIRKNETETALEMLIPLSDSNAFSEIAQVLMALLLDADGKRDEAKAVLTRAIGEHDPRFDTLCLAGDFFLYWKMPEAAVEAYDRAILLAPHASHAILRRGQALSEAGDITRAIEDLRRATLLQPNLSEAHGALGDELRDASMPEAAIASYRKALQADPANESAEIALDALIASLVPPWHPAMLNDSRRNDAFDAAIRRAVERFADNHGGSAADMHVLDIGTGTGLLAMMAIRAGAGHVTACETVGPLAEIAREIVARNDMEDRITVLHKRSTELAMGTDLPRPADLLTAEIVDAGLLSEAILPVFADARARLLTPAAAVVPRCATVFAVPIESAEIAAERRVDRAAGFDIAPFNDLRPRLYLQTDLSRYDWRPLSAPVELFRFDFTGDDAMTGDMSARIMPLSDGVAHGIALWFRLELDDHVALSTGPMDAPTHWKQAVYAVEPPIALNQNEPVRLHARHDGHRIRLRLSTR